MTDARVTDFISYDINTPRLKSGSSDKVDIDYLCLDASEAELQATKALTKEEKEKSYAKAFRLSLYQDSYVVPMEVNPIDSEEIQKICKEGAMYVKENKMSHEPIYQIMKAYLQHATQK